MEIAGCIFISLGVLLLVLRYTYWNHRWILGRNLHQPDGLTGELKLDVDGVEKERNAKPYIFWSGVVSIFLGVVFLLNI